MFWGYSLLLGPPDGFGNPQGGGADGGPGMPIKRMGDPSFYFGLMVKDSRGPSSLLIPGGTQCGMPEDSRRSRVWRFRDFGLDFMGILYSVHIY